MGRLHFDRCVCSDLTCGAHHSLGLGKLLLQVSICKLFIASIGANGRSLSCFASVDAGKIHERKGDINRGGVMPHSGGKTICSGEPVSVVLCSCTARECCTFYTELRD